MLNFEFADQLVRNPFSWASDFSYSNPTGTGIIYPADCRDTPIIMRSGMHSDGEINYTESPQFASRSVTISRLKEIIETCPMIIEVRSVGGGNIYLAGKGFLGYKEPDGRISCLFVALCDKESSWIGDIKFIVSRDIFLERYKRVGALIRDIGRDHPGDWIETGAIEKYLGQRLVLPDFATIRERKVYINQLLISCLSTIRETADEQRVAVTGPRNR